MTMGQNIDVESISANINSNLKIAQSENSGGEEKKLTY
jgi:hypothetical protein